jgi:Tol biopolymer transport system component
VELFSRAGVGSGSPQWSPDGKRIAFDSDLERNFDIYIIQASGGKAARLTMDSADDDAPSWSKDGKWIYFESKRTGRHWQPIGAIPQSQRLRRVLTGVDRSSPSADY